MNKKIVIVLLLSALIILTGASASFAKPEYLGNLTQVYTVGTCDSCHENGASGGARTSYGMLFENQSNHIADPSAALRAIGAPKSTSITPTAAATTSITPKATEGTPEAVTPEGTEEIPEETESEEETPVTTEAAKSPGFGVLASLVGLFAWALLAKRNNK